MSRYSLLGVVLLLFGSAGLADTTVVVTSTAQEVTAAAPTGIVNSNCTLGEAVLTINNLAGGGATVDGCAPTIMGTALPYRIELSAGATYALTEMAEPLPGVVSAYTTGLPAITTTLTISSASRTERATISRAPAAPAFGLLASVQNNGAAVELTLERLVLSGGDTAAGGAVYSNHTVTVVDSVLSDNRAAQGGGAVRAQRVEAEDSVFERNEAADLAQRGLAGSDLARGGAVWAEEVDLLNTELRANQADLGGAVYVTDTVSIVDAVFDSNQGRDGGAIWLEVRNDSEIETAQFVDNIATESGGAVFADFLNTRLNIVESEFSNNAARAGGALWLRNNLSSNVFDSVANQFVGNQASVEGGAVILIGSSGIPRVRFTDDLFYRNSSAAGGAISVNSGTLRVDLIRSNFESNSGGAEGGAVRVATSVFLRGSDSYFVDNEADRGGALFATNFNGFTLADSVLLNNRALDGSGGGVSVTTLGTPSLNGVRLEGNQATADGGAIYAVGPSFAIISNSEFRFNSATNGGAVSGSMNVQSSWFERNTATGSGGAVNLTQRRATFTACTLSNNSAANGGAIASTQDLQIERSTLIGNQASDSGGGIFGDGSADVELVLNDTTIVSNQAATGGAFAWFGNSGIDPEGVILFDNGPSACEFFQILLTDFTLTDDPKCRGFVGPVSTAPLSDVLDPVLRDNGGPTPTLALVAGSPAINQGDPLRADGLDQRDFDRVIDGVADLGAFEFGVELLIEQQQLLFSSGFEAGDSLLPKLWFDRDAFLAATGAGNAVDADLGPNQNFGATSITRGQITFTYFDTSGLFVSNWSDQIPANGSTSTTDLALNGIESFDMESSAPVTALGFDFVDPNGDQTLFEVTVCATTFDANSTYANGTPRQCPLLDTIKVFQIAAPGSERRFVGISATEAFQQVSIRDLSGDGANEFFGHVYTAP